MRIEGCGKSAHFKKNTDGCHWLRRRHFLKLQSKFLEKLSFYGLFGKKFTIFSHKQYSPTFPISNDNSIAVKKGQIFFRFLKIL